MSYYTTTYSSQAFDPNMYTLLPDVDQTIDEICRVWGVTREQVFGKSRITPIKYARWFIWHMLKARNFSAATISRLFFKDHATILHGLGQLPSDIKRFHAVREKWNQIKHLEVSKLYQ